MPGQATDVLEWPYVEGLRMDEAMHPLTILAVGLYGEVLPGQNGAPLRLVVPWKYGFKGIKSIVKVRFLAKQPVSSWQLNWPQAYGFYANVNPAVAHPRYSQAVEARLPSMFKTMKTLPFNGYGDQVASLYWEWISGGTTEPIAGRAGLDLPYEGGSTISCSTRSNTFRRWLRRSSATVDAEVVTTTRSRVGTTKTYCPPNPQA